MRWENSKDIDDVGTANLPELLELGEVVPPFLVRASISPAWEDTTQAASRQGNRYGALPVYTLDWWADN